MLSLWLELGWAGSDWESLLVWPIWHKMDCFVHFWKIRMRSASYEAWYQHYNYYVFWEPTYHNFVWLTAASKWCWNESYTMCRGIRFVLCSLWNHIVQSFVPYASYCFLSISTCTLLTQLLPLFIIHSEETDPLPRNSKQCFWR